MEVTAKQLTVKDVAELTGISEYTIRKKLREGELKGERTSDREGYRVSCDDLMDYLQKAKKPVSAKLAGVAGGLGIASALGSALGSNVSFRSGPIGCYPFSPPMLALGGLIGDGITSLFSKVSDVLREKRGNYKGVFDLTVDSLRHRIDALRYSIQALELKGDCLSVEEKQEILEGKAQIELLEQQINELRLKYELDQV